MDDLARTGANCVRIQWYDRYPPSEPGAQSRDPYTISDLDRVLEKCRRKHLIPIVELHDCTCKGDPELVNTQLMQWWTRPDVVAVLKKHEQYLIVNFANELGVYRWAKPPLTPAAALENFKNAYKKAITTFRTTTGLHMPIMIDAPDCGSSINAFLSIGKELVQVGGGGILLSAHAYWAGYDGTEDMKKAIDANLPIVFGEIANKQSETVGEVTHECYYGLDGTNLDHSTTTGFRYQDLLIKLSEMEVGWLAWAWYKDGCAPRRMTQGDRGSYAGTVPPSPTGLTPYGDDLLFNRTYGIRLGAYAAKPAGIMSPPWGPIEP